MGTVKNGGNEMERQSYESVTSKGSPHMQREKSPILTLTIQKWKLKSRLCEFLLKIVQLTSDQEGFQTLVFLVPKPVFPNYYAYCLKSKGSSGRH